MEDGRKPVLPNKVFDCTLRAALGWKGKVKNGMTLREICETLGVSRRALQGYEKAGLVTASGRNKYGHLLYDKDAEMRIAQIKFYQQLGFTIKEITRIIDAPEAELRSALEQRVQKLREEKTDWSAVILKEAMDSYETFMNEYCDFMEKYSKNPTDPGLIADYMSYMSKYDDFTKKFDQWGSEDLNDAELEYYIEVQTRVYERLAEAEY